MGRFNDLTGQKFGQLTVLSATGKTNQGTYIWACLCDCGKESIVRSDHLTGGKTKTCGCLRDENARKRMTKHGKYKSPEYAAWHGMQSRCYNDGSSSPRYKYRGIKVCDRWLESFDNFYADMGDKPSSKHSLDRIDNDGNYTPENCRWATASQQLDNTCRTIRMTLSGETKILTEWADVLNLNPKTLRTRKLRGWSDEQILTTPVRKRANKGE